MSRPDAKGALPIMVWVHGGNYDRFSKESAEALARSVSNRGFAVFNINYRKVPAAHLKEIIEDVMGAVIWAKDHAEKYGGDPDRLAVAGHSAGAHTVEVAALACRDDYFTPSYRGWQGNDACPAVVIPVSGYFEFEEEWAKWTSWLLGGERSQAPELYRKCEPASYDLSGGLPPHLVVFGDEDKHRQRGEQWAARLGGAGVAVETYMARQAHHNWIMWHWRMNARETRPAMAEFLGRLLKDDSSSLRRKPLARTAASSTPSPGG